MAVTTSLTTMQLIETISARYPQLTFTEGSEFRWAPHENIIYYDSLDSSFEARLLHELAHAELQHQSYSRDIDLIALERDAWQHAKVVLAPLFERTIDTDIIEDNLDTYRDWLHARSACPACSATGIQVSSDIYGCISCPSTWRVNEARHCGLKRYIVK